MPVDHNLTTAEPPQGDRIGGFRSADAPLSPVLDSQKALECFRQPGAFEVYLALKWVVYQRFLHHREGRKMTGPKEAEEKMLERISSRLLTEGGGALPPESLKGFLPIGRPRASKWIEDRLHRLNNGVFLAAEPHLLGGVRLYRWAEPLTRSTYRSFRKAHALAQGRLDRLLALRVLMEGFGPHPFSWQEATDALMHRARRTVRGHRRFGLVRPRDHRGTAQARETTQRLLADQVQHGFLEETQGGKWTATQKGLDAYHWFDLFAYSVDYVEGSEPVRRERSIRAVATDDRR